ncbi:hypothetical protein A3J41_02740 [candidate division TM6 bacterium RIFCSPHIGHO2_12_FULL_38_8]|nr:MAG: hypothetical protein A3J41_02740 [candidate division TM6 bacterium RIFCSPHIGHO2_12_FULL_38_8]
MNKRMIFAVMLFGLTCGLHAGKKSLGDWAIAHTLQRQIERDEKYGIKKISNPKKPHARLKPGY